MSTVVQTCEARTRKNRQCTKWSVEDGLCRQHLQVKAAGRLVTRFIADSSEEAEPPEIATAASAEVGRGPSSPCPAESRARTVTNPCQALTRKHQQCKNERVSGGLCETHLEMEKEGRAVTRIGGGSRGGAGVAEDAATVVAGKLAEVPRRRLSIKPVPGRLVTASRPSIRPDIPDDPPSPQSPLCPVPLLPYAARPATIRKGNSSWSHVTHKKELECAVHRLPRTSQVTGVRGGGADEATYGWKKMWAAVCKTSLTEKCYARGCQKESEVGAHVWLFDFKHQRYDHEHCYIVPLCQGHNGREFDYPHPFLLKRDVAVLRIVPHECYLDYGPLPSRRAAA